MSTDKSSQPHPHKSLLKSSVVVSLGVLTSRFLGFIRDMVLAHFLGTGLIAEAFFVAQRIPNLLRDLAGEGAANAAIVPVVVEYQEQKSKKDWLELIHVVMAWGIIILGLITLLGILFAPLIIKLIAPGFGADADTFALTVDLTRIMFPYLVLIGLTAFQMGVLYCLHEYKTPAFGPCLLNIAMILGAWVACMFSWPMAYALAGAVLVGGVWQFLLQWAALKKKGVSWAWPKSLRHPGARKIGKLMLPRLWGSSVYQINIMVDTLCASLSTIVGAGGIAALYYASRIIQLPLGVFGYALSSVSLGTLSALAAKNDRAAFRKTLLFALKNLMMVLVPSAIVLMIFSKGIIHLVFERGAFDAYSTGISAQVLFFSALGLPFYGASRLCATACFALHDTKTPVKVATICLCTNVVLNIILMGPFKVGGIALASSISSMINAWLLWNTLRKKLRS